MYPAYYSSETAHFNIQYCRYDSLFWFQFRSGSFCCGFGSYGLPFDADPVYLGLNPADFGLYPTADPARIGLYPTHFGRSGSKWFKSDTFGCGFGPFELDLTYF